MPFPIWYFSHREFGIGNVASRRYIRLGRISIIGMHLRIRICFGVTFEPTQPAVRFFANPISSDLRCHRRVNDSSRDWRWLSLDGFV